MTDLAEKKEDVKKKIRSLLLSAPVGLTLQELERDYNMFIGCRLPSRELGYTSTEEYLMSIPDVVQMSRRNGMLVLKGVSNAATQNIEKLVSKQKVDVRKSWGTLENKMSSQFSRGNESWNPGRRREPIPYNNPWRRDDSTAYNHNRGDYVHSQPPQHYREPTYRTARHRNMPSMPAYVRGQIYKLLQIYPNGFSLALMCSLFHKHFGVPLDHQRMGFSSLFDLLASVTDLVALKQLSPRETWVMPAESAITVEKFRPCLNNRPDAASREADGNENWDTKTENSPVLENSPGLIDTDPSQDGTTEGTCNIPSTIQDHIREIMASRPKGIWASRLPFEYKNIFKKDLSYKTYGYNSVIEFVSDLSHIVRIERPHPEGDWHLLPASVQQCVAEIKPKQPSTENKPVSIKVEEQKKEAISQVLCMCPDGVALDMFEEVYRKMTGQDLDIKKYGASDIKQFLQSLPDILCTTLNSSGTHIVTMKESARPRSFDKLKDQYQPYTRLHSQAVEPVLCLPTDAVSPGCLYINQQLPDFKDEPNFIDLFVSNVISPGVFWIQLIGRETTLALEDLMDELEAVYKTKQLLSTYSMTPGLAKPKMICAAIFPEDGNWHRAIITGIKDQLFEVYYVDYGNVCTVSITQMKLLKTKFMKLPAQAIRGRLSNIQPVDGVWKPSAKNRLLTLCREKRLVGLVTDFKDGVLSLCLTDTSQQFDIHINDTFVTEGYATFVQDTPDVENLGHSQAPSVEFLYGNDWSSSPKESKSAMPSSRRYIRQAQMMDGIVMNLINLDGQLYLLSSEISSLFFEEDILSAQLYRDNTDVSKLVITRKENPGLFKELAVYGTPHFTETTNVLSLFPLSTLPLIIQLYGQSKALDEVKGTALELLEWFHPDHPYWKGEDTSSGEEVPEVDSPDQGVPSDVPSLDDLQLVYQSLEIKKKRILNLIMKDSTSAPHYVNELNDVELNMKKVQDLITQSQNVIDNSGHDQSSVSSLPVKTGPVQKSTQKVAPTMQSSRTEQEPSHSSADGLSSQAARDMITLLQQRIASNSLVLEQLGISQVNNFMPSLVRNQPHQSLGRGLGIQQQLSQPGFPTTGVTQSCQDPLLSLGSGAGVQLNAANLLKGLGRGLPLELFTPQNLPVTDLFNQSQLLQSSLLQNHGQGNSLLQHQQSLQGSQLLQQMKNLNSSMAALGLNSLPVDNSLSYSQFAGLQTPTQNANLGQGGHGGLMQNLNGMTPSWYSGATAPVSMSSGLSSHTPSLVYGTSAASNVAVSNSLVNGALMQRQLQQSLDSMSDLASMLQMLNSGSDGNLTPSNTQPGV